MPSTVLIIIGILFGLILIGGLIGLLIWFLRRQSSSPSSSISSSVEVQVLPLTQLTYHDLLSLTQVIRQQLQHLSTATVFPSYLIEPLQSYRNAILNEISRIQQSGTPEEKASLQNLVPIVTPTIAPLTAIISLLMSRNDPSTNPAAVQSFDKEISTQLKRFYGSG